MDNLRELASACTCEDNCTQSGTKMIWNYDAAERTEIWISLRRNKGPIFITETQFVTFDHYVHEMFGCDMQRVSYREGVHKEMQPGSTIMSTCVSLLVILCVVHYKYSLKQTMNSEYNT